MNYLSKLFNLNGKVAVLTGASGYLCGEMAYAFHKAGCSIALLDSDFQKAKDIANKINIDGGSAISLKLDVRSKQDFKNALNIIIEKFDQLNILINGAGINAPTPFLDIDENEWDNILAVHLKGTLFSCQTFGEQMLKQGSGSIINISSASSGPPLSKAFTYSVAKAGIKNLTQNLAREWANKGVRVNALRPGFFPTEWSKNNFINQERQKAILAHTPMGRYGDPKELLGAVLWLSSDSASFVTGAEISVDGGFSAMTI